MSRESFNPIPPMTMPDRALMALALTLVTLSPAALHAQTMSLAHRRAIDDSVRQTLTRYTATMAQGHWDSAGAYYSNSPDFRWVEEGKVVARSAQDIRKYLGAMQPTMRIRTVYDSVETTALAPGIASVVTAFSTTMGDSGSAGFTFAGELTMTMIHERDGWVILNGHSSAVHPH
jgi:hypothetical protein